MKLTATLFVAIVSADAPPAYNEPPFAVGTHPAATGLIALNAMTACKSSGISGVTCGPSDHELFAVGMKGDSELELKIQMKGDKFDTYNQKLLMIESAEEPEDESEIQFATGEKGDADLALPIQMKANRFDTYKETLVQLNEDPVSKAELDAEKKADVAVKAKPAPVEVLDTDKVFTLDPKIAKSHTTFYKKQ